MEQSHTTNARKITVVSTAFKKYLYNQVQNNLSASPTSVDEQINHDISKNKLSNNAAFEFDGDYSKDLDSSGLFEFSLEGEKLVSSLCGPQSKGVDKEDVIESNKLVYQKTNQELNYIETFKGNTPTYKTSNNFLSKHFDAGMSFSNAITSTPKKDNSKYSHEQDLCNDMNSSNKISDQVYGVKLDKSKSETDNSSRHSGSDKESLESSSSEMKNIIIQQSNTNSLESKSMTSIGSWIFGQLRSIDMKECNGNKMDSYNLIQQNNGGENMGNNVIKSLHHKSKTEEKNITNKSASVPNIFSMMNKFSQGDNFFITSNNENKIPNSEGKNEILSDNCDDEISFRKSAITGCLVFERIIKDLNIVTHDHDLENYCKTVKRCVSVASTIECRELTVLISELIFSFLKLADSWGILNSYFGESGNAEYKPKNLDDINLYQSFQDWQIKSRSLLDHLIVVIQNLKESVPKGEEKENKLLKESQTPKFSQINPLLNQAQSKCKEVSSVTKTGNTSYTINQPLQKDTINFQPSPFHMQEIQFPKNIANIFTAHNQNNNWKQNVPEIGQKKPSDVYWELSQNNQQNSFNLQTANERKQRKRWTTVTTPDFQTETPCTVMPGQGITMQQTQPTGQIPAVNFQYVAQSKGPVENMIVKPFNFFGNQYSALPHNIQNVRENTSSSYCYNRQPAYYQNLKQVNLCNPQMNIPLLQNNIPQNPFNMMDETKSNIIYQNFCIGDSKSMATNTNYGTPFFHNEMYHSNSVTNQNMFGHKNCEQKTMIPVPVNNADGDDSSEEYYPIKSYMKPGSYRVPNKSKSLVLQSTNNLNYIFDDVLVTGITVPFTKSNIFSQSKKNISKPANTNEKSIQTSRTDDIKSTDLVWKAALASAEVLGKSLMCKQDKKNQSDKNNMSSQEKSTTKTKEPVLEESNTVSETNQTTESCKNNICNDCVCNKNKEENRSIDSEVTKSTIKTDDWLIQSFSKLEGQSDLKEAQAYETERSNDISNNVTDLKSNSLNTKNMDSDDSDNTANDNDSEDHLTKERGINQKRDKNTKQKVSSNIRSVSILQKPREYCQSRNKPWDKPRDFSFQIPSYKGDSRNIHKNPANWVKYNRKCINRQTLFRLQEILNSLSKMETSNLEMQKSIISGIQSSVVNSSIIVLPSIAVALPNSTSSADPPKSSGASCSTNLLSKKSGTSQLDLSLILAVLQLTLQDIIHKLNKTEYSNIIELTNKLEIFFDELVEKHFGQQELSDSREPSNQNGSPLAIKNRRTQKVQRKLN
ncbi:uncharacterized protein LOC142317571 [Lycorma delicatula]|uniref:uncharacterized protein LOC142317571 n=1 Tax=Lycorma delicatula TaxID=130591 RepID=UPI003F50ED0C